MRNIGHMQAVHITYFKKGVTIMENLKNLNGKRLSIIINYNFKLTSLGFGL